MTKTKVVLVRHGESIVTVRRVIGGPRTCTGLSELGTLQAAALRDRLASTKEIAADVLISSAYPRALQTAEIVKGALGFTDVVVDPNFGEHDPGPECDGLSFDEYVRRYGRPDWGGDPHAVVFPGGETIAQFHDRVYGAFDATVRAHFGKTVVVACHGGVIDAILRRIVHAPSTGKFEIHTRNCSLTEMVEQRDRHWALIRYNDHAHLRDLPEATPSE